MKIDTLDSEATQAAPPKPPSLFTIWKPSVLLDYVEPPGSHLLLPKYLTRGQLTAIIGPAGVGKSRLLLNLAVAQVTGQPWLGIDTAGAPQVWMMLGNENSVSRLQEDYRKILSTVEPEFHEVLEEHLLFHAVTTPDDGDLDLSDVTIRARLVDTLKLHSPGVVCLDPLANLHADDLSKPGPMKDAVRLVHKVVQEGAMGSAMILLHHAREGRTNLVQAVGFDAGNFASGGKALLARCRCVINLAPLDENDSGSVLVACAKANDCRKFSHRAAVFDPETSTYSIDSDFNLDSRKASVEGKRGADSSLTAKDVVECVMSGHTKTASINEALMADFDTSKATCKRALKNAVKREYLTLLSRGIYTLGPKHNLLFDKK